MISWLKTSVCLGVADSDEILNTNDDWGKLQSGTQAPRESWRSQRNQAGMEELLSEYGAWVSVCAGNSLLIWK